MSSSTDPADEIFESVRFDLHHAAGGVASRAPAVEGATPWEEIVAGGPPEEPPAPAGTAGDGGPPVSGDTALLFDEEELARICAAVAWRSERKVHEAAARREAEFRSAALARFEAGLTALVAEEDAVWNRLRGRLAEVVGCFAEAAVPMLVQRLGKEEVTAAVGVILARLGPEDRLEVRVAPDLAEDLSRLLPATVGTTGQGTEWQVVADPSLAAGDFRIDRRHGFLERRAEEICARIAEAVGAVLKAADRAEKEDGASPNAEQEAAPEPAEEWRG